MRRRDFIRTTCAGIGAYTLGTRFGLADTTGKLASDIVTLGKSGIKASRLAMGTGTHGSDGSSDQTRLGLASMSDLFKHAYDHGVNFWDSADQYGSHPNLKDALKGIPREKVVILTKTHASTADEMKADLDRFRQEIGTDYIDILLLHCMTDPNWPQQKAGAMDVLSEAAQKGIVKMHGTSCHTFGALTTAANTDWVQVDLARINPAGVIMDAAPDKVVPVLRDMKKKGKAVIGMKIFGEGRLISRMDECLKFVMGLDCVDCFTIGSRSKDDLSDLVKRIPAAANS
ncbi:MAG TPA: aldo/keto reductase [Verrucomicrobiae bacterium]|nr:aldo/keto reductase [Verrucomicrobiae bacterium]